MAGRPALALLLLPALALAERAGSRPLVDHSGTVDPVSAEAVVRLARAAFEEGGPTLLVVVVGSLGEETLQVRLDRAMAAFPLSRPHRDDRILLLVARGEEQVACSS